MDIITFIMAKKYADSKLSGAISEVASNPFTYQGGVSSYADLPSSSTKGYVYTTSDTGDEYLWDGSVWVRLGGNVATDDEITDYVGLMSAILGKATLGKLKIGG